MSSAENMRAREEQTQSAPGRNRPAKVSLFFAACGYASLGNFFTGIAWLNPGIFVSMAVLSALTAVVSGHVGRYRGRRLGGDGRGMALAGILLGWLLLFICVLIGLAFIGFIAGLTFLTDNL
ncbi:DUF4190 domain-containing protein [Streptomyces sp900116325]|uniref:DUF4190 domain-containing protein n=1 Tax=Streptomyces sp. 900116325 TaxID=3154295 RepID=UPI003332EA80